MSERFIIFASDHAGCELKEGLAHAIAHTHAKSDEVISYGAWGTDSVDYPDFAHLVCDTLASLPNSLGVLICGSGIGMSIAANRHKHIRCALAVTPEMARLARLHNDANVLAIGARFVGVERAMEILDAFLTTEFEGGRHAQRIAKLNIRTQVFPD